MPPRDGVRAKIGRAEMHLRCLEDLLKRFGDTKPYVLGVERESDPDPTVGVNHFFIVRSSDPVPPTIGLVAGDVLTNLRASLDHLAWQLVLADPASGQPDDHTAFPIKDKAPRAPGSGAPAPLRISGGVSAKALARIKDAQPYKTPDGGTPHEDRLWILERLVGIDKHRHLLLTTAGYDRVSVGVYGRRRSTPLMETPIALKEGAYISTFFTPDLGEQVDVDIDLATTVVVCEGEPGGGQPLSPLLRRLLGRVRDEVVPAFNGLR